LAVVILALSIAALVCGWFISRLTLIPASPSQVITSQGFELLSTIVKTWTSTTTQYQDYEQLVLLETMMVINACRGFAIVTLVSSLIVALMAFVASSEDLASLFTSSSTARSLYARLPRWLSFFCVFFSIGSVLILLGLINSMPRDDIIRQVTNGALTCDSGVFDCNSFWSDNVNVAGGNTYRDYHRPHTSFWLMVAASVLSIKLWLTVLKHKSVLEMTSEFNQREEEMQASSNSRAHQV